MEIRQSPNLKNSSLKFIQQNAVTLFDNNYTIFYQHRKDKYHSYFRQAVNAENAIVFVYLDDVILDVFYFINYGEEHNLNNYFAVCEFNSHIDKVRVDGYFLAVKAAYPEHVYTLLPKTVKYIVTTIKPTKIRPFKVCYNLYKERMVKNCKYVETVKVIDI